MGLKKVLEVIFLLCIIIITFFPISICNANTQNNQNDDDVNKLEPILSFGNGGFQCFEYSPDGSELAVGASANILILNTYNYEIKQKLFGHCNTITSISWSPDSTKLTSGSKDTTVKIWDLGSGNCIQTYTDHETSINDVAWSPNGKYIASGTDEVNSNLRVWDANSEDQIKEFSIYSYSVDSIAWANNKNLLALGKGDGNVEIINSKTWKSEQILGEQRYTIHSVAWSNDDSIVLSGSHDGTIKVWDTSNWDEVTTLEDHFGTVNDVDFSNDDDYFASCSQTGSEVLIWYTNNWSVKESLSILYNYGPKTLSWDQNDENLAVMSFQAIIEYNTQTWQSLKIIKHDYYSTFAPEWSPDGKMLAVGLLLDLKDNNNDLVREVNIYETRYWQIIHKFTESTITGSAIKWSPDGSMIAISYEDNTIKIFNTILWKEIAIINTVFGNVSEILWNPNGDNIVTISFYRYMEDNYHKKVSELELWETNNWKKIQNKLNLSERKCPIWTLDGDMLIVCNKQYDGTNVWENIEMIDIATMAIKDSFIIDDFAISSLGISPDDSTMAAGIGNKIRFYNLNSMINFYNYTNFKHSSEIEIKWSPDGTRIAIEPYEGNNAKIFRIILIDGGDYQFLQNITGHSSKITNFNWNTESNEIVSTSEDGTFKVYSDDKHTTNTKSSVEIKKPNDAQTYSGIIDISGIAADNEGLKNIQIKIDDSGRWVNANGTDSWNILWNSGEYLDNDIEILARAFDGYLYSEVDQVTIHVTNSDFDNDPISDELDPDDDNDGYNDSVELSEKSDPYSSNSMPNDLDNDLIPDTIDDDIDNDGYPNQNDSYPNDPNKWKKQKDDGKIPSFDLTILLIVIIILISYNKFKRIC